MKERYFYVAYSFTAKNHHGHTISGNGSIQLITLNGLPINHSMKTMMEATKYIENNIKNSHSIGIIILNIIELFEG